MISSLIYATYNLYVVDIKECCQFINIILHIDIRLEGNCYKYKGKTYCVKRLFLLVMHHIVT